VVDLDAVVLIGDGDARDSARGYETIETVFGGAAGEITVGTRAVGRCQQLAVGAVRARGDDAVTVGPDDSSVRGKRPEQAGVEPHFNKGRAGEVGVPVASCSIDRAVVTVDRVGDA
jgi:hypothetical protein